MPGHLAAEDMPVWSCSALAREEKQSSCSREEYVLEPAMFPSKPKHTCVHIGTRWHVVKKSGIGGRGKWTL